MIPTLEEIEGIASPNGDFTPEQMRIVRMLVGCESGWKKRLTKKNIDLDTWQKLIKARMVKRRQSISKEKIKEMSKKQAKAAKLINKGKFYESREWQRLRYRVIRKYGAKCQCCGRSPAQHGIAIHVDHIKPKSKFPELALDFGNMQVLCEDCNMGKSNDYADDWRDIEKDLDIEYMANIAVFDERK